MQTFSPDPRETYSMSKRRLSSDEYTQSDDSDHRAPKLLKTEGDSESSRNLSSTVKILSWNVETPVPFIKLPGRKAGSPSTPAGTHPKFLRDMLRRHGFPDFLCLQEIRARPSDTDWVSALQTAVNLRRDDGPHYTIYTSLNRASKSQRHFGVATFVKRPHDIAVARELDWDLEGRVSILETNHGWALVNVYALNGSEYTWKDPLGRGTLRTRNERKREFNRLLMEECQKMQARGLRLVLIGDFNISLTEKDCFPRLRTEYPHGLARKEFNEQFIPGLNVVDVFRERHPDRVSFSWFAKGRPQGKDCARVDYALVQRELVRSVLDIRYLEDPEERAHSDHAPLILVMDATGLNITHSALQGPPMDGTLQER